MLKRVKRALVESYIGAIGLGYLLAQIVLHFVAVFSAPVAVWVQERTTMSLIPRSGPPPRLQLQDALPEVLNFLLLLLLWYLLLRWLYLEKPAKDAAGAITNQGQSA